jgi:hypothetical protein
VKGTGRITVQAMADISERASAAVLAAALQEFVHQAEHHFGSSRKLRHEVTTDFSRHLQG